MVVLLFEGEEGKQMGVQDMQRETVCFKGKILVHFSVCVPEHAVEPPINLKDSSNE